MALQLGLELLRQRGETRALVTVHPNNSISNRVLLANWGIQEGHGEHPVSGDIVEHYWIDL